MGEDLNVPIIIIYGRGKHIPETKHKVIPKKSSEKSHQSILQGLYDLKAHKTQTWLLLNVKAILSDKVSRTDFTFPFTFPFYKGKGMVSTVEF